MTHTAARSPIHCHQCSMQSVCVPAGLNPDKVEAIDLSSRKAQVFNSKATVFEAGQKLSSVYAIKSGSVKCFTLNENGQQQITAFHLVGDIIGLEALATGAASTYCETLETSMLCEIKLGNLFDQNIDGVNQNLIRLLSQRLSHNSRQYINIVSTSAEQKVASFLLLLSEHMQQHGRSPGEFKLPMKRTDIANYMGLAIETVSRVFTQLKKQGIITSEQSMLTILDRKKLHNRSVSFKTTE